MKQTAVSVVSGAASGALGGSSLGKVAIAGGNAAISAASSAASDLIKKSDGEQVSGKDMAINAGVSGLAGLGFGYLSGNGLSASAGEYVHYTPNRLPYQKVMPSAGMIMKNLELSAIPQGIQSIAQPYATEWTVEQLQKQRQALIQWQKQQEHERLTAYYQLVCCEQK